MSFIYSLQSYWTDVATTYNGIEINISDGAGGAPMGSTASRILDLQANGVSVFSVDANGVTRIRQASTQAMSIQRSGATTEPMMTFNTNNSASNIQFLNQQNATRAAAIGISTPGVAFVNDGVMSCFNGSAWVEVARWLNSGGFSIGTGALATTATDGFLYIPTSPGPPTGVPTAKTGLVPMLYDNVNEQFYFYSGGAWKRPRNPGAGAIITWQV